MDSTDLSLANFVIAGADKAGTTSVFVYLSQHPEVCAASKKETDFFRIEYTGDKVRDEIDYSRYFRNCQKSQPVIMEASPAYLSDAALVVPRIRSMIPDARILFILRDPVERLYSFYRFNVGKLNIPDDMSFAEFVQRCDIYNAGHTDPADLGLSEWCLQGLKSGLYVEYLKQFYTLRPQAEIKIMFFEMLRDDTACFMEDLSKFLGINERFWCDYEFLRNNASFAGRNKLLHRAAMGLNAMAEPLLRQRPALKHSVVGVYKSLNQARDGFKPMSGEMRQRLARYYHQGNLELVNLLNVELPASWHTDAGNPPQMD
jgi:hypothetical protein